ncbi:hypothetical protein N657DRAFT_686545 [Parathielavia appendiculata]|uniref:Zonadhesin n=1 Tax=Parathielavia appendiculata TaxID=2587402 RepID=A0AAN6U9Z0_9PEZI|nr:hypothetical protein N657DRAFT_686545 [Parathielavia appendiculata]
MQQSFMQPQDDRATYEYTTIQATEDRHEGPAEDASRDRASAVWRSQGTPDYKPKPLQWPFISTVMVLLLVAIALVVVAEKQLPDSDSSARILGLHPNASQPEGLRFARAARDAFTNTSSEATVDETAGDPPPSPTTPTTLVMATTTSQIQGSSTTSEEAKVPNQNPTAADSRKSTTQLVSEATASTSTQPSNPAHPFTLTTSSLVAASLTTTSSVSTLSPSTVSLDPGKPSTSTAGLPSSPLSSTSSPVRPSTVTTSTSGSADVLFIDAAPGSSTTTSTVSRSTEHVSATNTASLPSGARVATSVSVGKVTGSVTSMVTTVTTYTVSSDETISFTTNTTYETTKTLTVPRTRSSPMPTSLPSYATSFSGPAQTQTEEYDTITVTEIVTTPTVLPTVRPTFSTVTSTIITDVVIPTTGEFTETFYETIYPPNNSPNNPEMVTAQNPGPGVVTGTAVVEGTVEIVKTNGPVILVVTVDEQKTQVVEPQVTTGVVRVGGSEVTNVVVITPTPGNSDGVVTVVGGSPVTIVNTLGPVTATTVVDGVQRTIIETPPPQTVVRIDGGVTATILPGQLVTSTVVNNIGGTPVTRVVVTTPAGPPFEPITYTIVRDVGGTLVTEAITTTPTGAPDEPVTFTAVDIVGGTPVTQLVVTTANGVGFQPVSYTITTIIGGTPTVVTVTPGPTTIVETIDGAAVTRVTTPPVTSFTATVGGTLTTQILVTTPADAEPITLTFVSTSGGTLSTFTSTFPPSTFVTTISGTLRTITSTPSPSTFTSTLPISTLTWTSTTSPTNTANARPTATVIPSTRVHRWTEADIFIGTFLPALLGVALIIPLRIIDLNAKLYQPYQALAKQQQQQQQQQQLKRSQPGADTLLLQYTGLWAFVTPAVTLLQGHPVPFLTTLMVGCASFMVPLATEAVGLKLHGECYLNTASSRCGPALGVSPVPAHALVGLMAAVVVLLGLVLFLVSRWVTGVWANPWSLAGIASLARNEHVRIRQEGEMGMRRELAEKQYGLGYFRNEGGREEYGIVLMDEEARGLHREEDGPAGDTESDLLVEPGLTAKWGGGSRRLPFMTLRYPWRIAFVLFQLAVFVFVVYYHAYYRGGIRDDGRLWLFLNSNTFGVRFVSAVVGVIIAFCWQAFFLSVSQMTPFYLLSLRTRPPDSSILFTPSTNPFSGIYSSVRHRQPFLFAVSFAAILSEFLPVILSNVPFNLAQTGTAATVCAVLSCLFLGVMLAVLAASFFVRYPPMPVDPRCVAGLLWYVSKSKMLEDFEGVSRLEGKERALRVKEMGRRYFYGVLMGGGDGRRLGVDCDVGGGGEDGMGYLGAQGILRGRGDD